MTYYGAKELAAAFRTVRGNTIRIAEDIPEEQYGFRATPDTRSVAEYLVHITSATRFQEQFNIVERRTTLVGFDFLAFLASRSAEEKKPRTKREILDLLRSDGERFASLLEGLSEGFLAERVEHPNGLPSKSRFEMLLGPKEHEMHHRAQLMAIERMLGITPHLTRQMQERIAGMKAGTEASRQHPPANASSA